MALIMRTADLGSYRGAGSTASSQGGRVGNGLRITQMRAARDFGRRTFASSARGFRGARVNENLLIT
jgi:hypothetical protein